LRDQGDRTDDATVLVRGGIGRDIADVEDRLAVLEEKCEKLVLERADVVYELEEMEGGKRASLTTLVSVHSLLCAETTDKEA